MRKSDFKWILLMIAATAIIMVVAKAVEAQPFERESYYSDYVCETVFHGEPTQLQNGLRPDCETYFAVIEFDWATRQKHYECIGQALVYARYTVGGKIPVCVLLARTDEELDFGNTVAAFGGIGVRTIVIDVRELDVEGSIQ